MKCIRQVTQAVFLMFICSACCWSQTVKARPAETTAQPSNSVPSLAPVSFIAIHLWFDDGHGNYCLTIRSTAWFTSSRAFFLARFAAGVI